MKIGISKHLRKYGDIMFLCHKLRILCVRKSEIWHAWVRFIPQTALVRAFHCDTKFLLNQFSTKNWCYIILFPCSMMCFKFVRESLKANFSKCNLINIRKGANGAIVWMFRNFCIYVNPWSEDAELPRTHFHTNLTFLGQEKLLRRTQIQLILNNIKIAINIDQAMLKSLVYISENK